jgi:peptidoglycan hydrolase-like protein with peptidoglycan-binding domain
MALTICRMADEPELQKSQSGEWVQYLQQLLEQKQYWSGKADGDFNDSLEQSVLKFQSDHGLVADGVVGATTWATVAGKEGQSSSGQSEPGEREVTLSRDELPALFHLLSFENWEDWARGIGLDVELLQTDDELV